MAAKKTTKRSSRASGAPPDAPFTVILEELRSQFRVFGEALQGMREHMDQRFEQVDQRFEQVDQRFEQVDQRFEQVDQRFEQVNQRFEQVDRQLVTVNERLGRVENAVGTHSKELLRIASKLDTTLLDHETRISKVEGAAE